MSILWSVIGNALLGGLLIGLASWLLLISIGRITGISGIVASLIPSSKQEDRSSLWRWMFLVGLIGGGAFAFTFIDPPLGVNKSFPLLIAAGILVGMGTVIGSGCTSGHGVCGLGRRSMRSLIATVIFMLTGVITVSIMQYITNKIG